MIYKSAEGGTGYMTLQKKSIQSSSVYAVLLLGMFTFLFLGTEYMYVNMLSRTVGEEQTVIAQDYALGVSALGFFLYPPVRRFLKRGAKTGLPVFLALVAVGCNFFIQRQSSYRPTLLSGLTLFLVLGFLGSMVHDLFFRLAADWACLARLVGLSYSLGILLQFLNNNLTSLQTREAWILSGVMLGLLAILPKAERISYAAPMEEGDFQKANRKQVASGVLLALLIVLMACIFSTLDNAVTLRHGSDADIGQWPRLLLAASGLGAGFLFDIQKRKYMTVMMYCIMLLSVICVVVLKLGGSFLIGLLVFYFSAGFFAVFFTTCFLDFACQMPNPLPWTGMGRAMNNVSAALLANGSVALLVSDSSGLVAIVLTLGLFVAVSVIISLYTAWMTAPPDTPQEPPTAPDPQEAFRLLSDSLALTPREIEVFDKLVNSEESIQEIADTLYLSRRTCQRHIASIYEKAGVKSRLGLYQIYIERQHRR